MKQLYFLLLLCSFAASAQTADDCTEMTAIPIDELRLVIEADTPYVAGDTTFYCTFADSEAPFDINVGNLAELTVTTDEPELPITTIVNNLTDDIIDTLDMIGESVIITDKTLYSIEVIAISPGTGSLEIMDLVSGTENDTIGVRVIAPLPVEWGTPLSYRAEAKHNTFSWSVLRQVEVESYQLERLEANRFEAVEYVAPTGPSDAEVWYTATDIALEETTTYRIRQTDYDGTMSYSSLLTVPGRSDRKGLNIYPNPVSEELNYSFPGKIQSLILYNTLGKVERTVAIPASAGTLSVAPLRPGLYLLSVVDAKGKRYTKKVQVR